MAPQCLRLLRAILTPRKVQAVDSVTMPAESVANQLATVLDRQATMAADVAVIKERTSALADHETRIRALEATKSKLAAIWAAAVVLGAVIGWLAAYLTRPR